MRKSLTMAVLLLAFGSAQAHVPPGVTLGVWQWPSSALPTMDGDIGEWEVIPDYLWLTPSTLDTDGNALFHAVAGDHKGMDGTENDASDLTIRVAVAWNDEFDRMYFAQERFDDVYDRDVAEPPGACGGDDSIEVHVDADHSGGLLYYSGDDFPDTDEGRAARTSANGRDAQIAHFRFPPIGEGNNAWHWLWVSAATWHDRAPYSCCPDSYDLDGEHGGTDVTLTAEWWSVYFNALVHESPEESVIAPLSEGQVIGMGVAFCDIDGASNDSGHNSVWRSGGPGGARWYADSDVVSDWLLLENMMTAVESNSWGQVKASLEQ